MADEIDFDHEVEVLLSAGILNSFMAGYLTQMRKPGLDEANWQEAIDDAKVASKAGVDSEEDFKTFFYISHFVDDLTKEMFGAPLSASEKEELKSFMFAARGEFGYSKLSDFKSAILKWVESKKKKVAHPNSGSVYKVQPKYDLDKWHRMAAKVVKAMERGFGREYMVSDLASTLPVPEKYDFMAWMNHLIGENGKYDVNDEIKWKNRMLSSKAGEEMESITKVAFGGNETYYYVPTYRTPIDMKEEKPFKPSAHEQNALDFESVRKKMIGRVFAIDRLIEKYRKVLTEEQVSGIESSLNDLKSKIRKLKQASTVGDVIRKTAGILKNRFDFEEGARYLVAVAEDPTVDPMTTSKEEGGLLDPEVPEDTAAGAIEHQQAELQKVIQSLYWIGQTVKSRGLVRELAKVDIMLSELGMSGFFPEIQDAMARMVESMVYVGNKIEDVMPKIQSGLVAGQLGKAVEKEKAPLAEEVKDLAKNIKPIHESGVPREEKAEPTPQTPPPNNQTMKMEVPLSAN